MISIVLLGARGRMGQAVEAAAADVADVEIRARVDRVVGPAAASSGYRGQEDAQRSSGALHHEEVDGLEAVVHHGDVVVDFSSPEGTLQAARLCAERGAGLVTGTTGLPEEAQTALAEASKRAAVLQAANFSLGILALRKALSAALDVLGPGWDIEIVERHHRRKADSPSGTALLLAREAAARRGLDDRVFRGGREGRVGPRTNEEIGIHAVRGGSWIGDHTILLASEGESLELRHVAQSRAAFAQGAIQAARFVARAAPGLYALEDVPTP